ncbi:MAG: hypothetical protein A2Z97_01310 [Bdellovibrionales bacterium GWB1_52_6]|nr:MAG: hypothetical protein A2Z97_01310 [Bdellovibrionales bacterium GWB1_52_6]
MKSSMAVAAQCQTTYVSKVLHGDRHFSLEQAELINLFLQHSPEEAKFFILLVSIERAGNPALKKRWQNEINAQIEKHHSLKDRLKTQKEQLSPEVQSTYYRVWYFTAAHFCLTISKLRTREALQRALGISNAQVKEALEFLLSVGLAEKHGNEYRTGKSVIFVGRDSPYLHPHHINWRHQAIRSIENLQKDDVHYSSVLTLTATEVAKVRSIFLKAIEEAREIGKSSKNEEELHSVCVDCFRVDR